MGAPGIGSRARSWSRGMATPRPRREPSRQPPTRPSRPGPPGSCRPGTAAIEIPGGTASSTSGSSTPRAPARQSVAAPLPGPRAPLQIHIPTARAYPCSSARGLGHARRPYRGSSTARQEGRARNLLEDDPPEVLVVGLLDGAREVLVERMRHLDPHGLIEPQEASQAALLGRSRSGTCEGSRGARARSGTDSAPRRAPFSALARARRGPGLRGWICSGTSRVESSRARTVVARAADSTSAVSSSNRCAHSRTTSAARCPSPGNCRRNSRTLRSCPPDACEKRSWS